MLPEPEVLYEDNHLLVVLKPAGTLVQGDRTGDLSMLDIGKQWLIRKYQKPGNAFLGLVHRLDRPVAGVMVFAKSSKAAGRLSAQFRERTVQKSYLTVVQGQVHRSAEALTHYLRRQERSRPVQIARSPFAGASVARLSYRVAARRGQQSLLQVALDTGRHHQIRAQLACIGHPVVGDVKYGADCAMLDRKIALFAHQLEFSHPTLQKPMRFEADPPSEWPWTLFSRTVAHFEDS